MKQFLSKLILITWTINVLILSTTAFSEPANLGIVKTEVKKYHDSGLYEKEFAQVIQSAQNYILHQAKMNQNNSPNKKLAIVLDIDETSLSNYNSMIQRDFTATRAQFHQDILRANAPAMKPTLALYQEAMRHNIRVFFVTGRHQSEREATTKNLIKAGYAQWDGLYLRPDHYTPSSIIPFKSHARELIMQQGYTILATIGDQWSDLKGGFAEKEFKLPNPYYYLP
jgi:acid phosphatase